MTNHNTERLVDNADYSQTLITDKWPNAKPRPSFHTNHQGGFIRGMMVGAGLAASLICLAHIAMADPLGRAMADLDRAAIEYCGRC